MKSAWHQSCTLKPWRSLEKPYFPLKFLKKKNFLQIMMAVILSPVLPANDIMSKEPDWNKSKVIHSAFSFFINEETKRTLSFFSRSWWRCSYDYLVTHIFFSQLWINLKIKQSASKRKGPWGLLKIKVPCLLVEGVSLTFVVPRQYFPRSTDGKIWQHWKFLLPRTNSNKMLIMKIMSRTGCEMRTTWHLWIKIIP